MATALISLGSNLGDRAATLDAAQHALRGTDGIEQIVVSAYHSTQPVGGPVGQGEFLNAAARLETSLLPPALVVELQRIESALARTRETRWGPRTLDLDLLLYDREVIESPFLTLPHRLMPFRRFVLEPAAEVAAEMVHPVLRESVASMLQRIQEAPESFGVFCVDPELAQEFSQRLAHESGFAIQSTNDESTQYRLYQSPKLPNEDKAMFVLQTCRGATTTPPTTEHDFHVPTLILLADDFPRALREAAAVIQSVQ